MEIILDISASVPLFTQLADQIKEAVRCDELRPGDPLPSARQLANDLGLDGETVIAAYRLLERESVVRTSGIRRFIYEHALPHLDLEVSHARKTQELAEARDLQLSLLPAELPSCPGFEVAAAMMTATEVGGDYYDFDAHDGGELTVEIDPSLLD